MKIKINFINYVLFFFYDFTIDNKMMQYKSILYETINLDSNHVIIASLIYYY